MKTLNLERVYKGTIVQESLKDDRVLNGLEVLGYRVTNEEDPGKRWHLITVEVDEDQIKNLSTSLKYAWYAHFWLKNHEDMIVIFENKVFKINYKEKSTWLEAVSFGKSMNIPDEQLDFLIEE